MMNSKEMMETTEKLVLQGGISAATMLGFYGQDGRVTTPIGDYPLYMVAGVLGATTSLTNDLLHKYVFSEIPVNKKTKNDLSLLLSLVTSGLSFNLAMAIVHPDLPKEFGIYKGIALGAGSEVLSGLVLDMIR